MANEGAVSSREVDWPLDDTTMYGTLVMPAGSGPFPALVLVAGSGPTDRDWNSPLISGTNGSGRLLAEGLAADGFASLRYDKRSAGPHAAENLARLSGKVSLQSHLDELTGAVHELANAPGVDPAHIFALTNSEGALHALNYQIHSPEIPFAGLVLIAPPGRPVGAVGRSQIVAQLAGLPNGTEMIAAYDAAIAAFEAGEPVSPDPSLPEGVLLLLRSLASPINLPFGRELWVADAAAWLAQVRAPVLVLIGKKDLQVSWQADGGPLEQAVAGRTNFTFGYPENANHVIKHLAVSPATLSPEQILAGYNGPDTELDPEALAAVRGWLTSRS